MALPGFIGVDDLAPGDIPQLERLPGSIELCRIRSAKDAGLDTALAMLETEFIPKNEMEPRDVIVGRLSKNVAQDGDDPMRYELCLLKCDGEAAAVCDHTAIYECGGDFENMVVHVSHALVVKKWRGHGLAALLRAIPVRTAREFARELDKSRVGIALVAEMDPFDPHSAANVRRRQSFGKAGFKVVGKNIGYLQPDFRAKETIDAASDGTCPVKLEIVLRLVGDEGTDILPADDLKHMIAAVYRMYAREISPREMAPCLAWFVKFAARTEPTYPLQPPTKPATTQVKS